MVLAGSYGCHATADATADVLWNGSSKYTSAATACSTHSYGSHELNRPHWTFLQGKRGCTWTTWSWWVSAARGKGCVTTTTLSVGHLTHYSLLAGQTTIRSTSPLPPNVPTGPRNQNKYKDRDGLTANVDGLDYGGGRDTNNNTPPEERSR
jgi:hypothetical protein